MTAQPALASWERRLLEGARCPPDIPTQPAVTVPPRDLHYAYLQCVQITREHSQTFFLASALLPSQQRRAMRALYAFCRTADDIVDNPGVKHRRELLEYWRSVTSGSASAEYEPVAIAWTDVQNRFCIPQQYAEQLLTGVEQDLSPHRYHTFDELALYCYNVASTVGLMAMHIIGFSNPAALPYAIRLGVALQLTNILRDVGTDGQLGRLYLPLAELSAFGLSEADVAGGGVNNRWRAFMRFQIDRARQLYREALPGLRYLHPQGRPAVAAAAHFYQAILHDIERHDYDVWSRRAHISTSHKLRLLPRVYLHPYALERQ